MCVRDARHTHWGKRRSQARRQAPSIKLVESAVVRAVNALLHVVLKEPVLESRSCETAVEHANVD